MTATRRRLLATGLAAALLIPVGVLTGGPAAAEPYTPNLATVDVTLPAGVEPADITKDTLEGVTIAVDSPDDTLDYTATGGGEIKGRGNSTWRLDKKPYQFKLASPGSSAWTPRRPGSSWPTTTTPH